MARENVQELINKATVHTYVEEREAFSILWGATRRLKSLISGLKVKQIKNQIEQAEERALNLMSDIFQSEEREKTIKDAKEKESSNADSDKSNGTSGGGGGTSKIAVGKPKPTNTNTNTKGGNGKPTAGANKGKVAGTHVYVYVYVYVVYVLQLALLFFNHFS